MSHPPDALESVTGGDTLYPDRTRRLRRAEVICQVVGIAAVVLQQGQRHAADHLAVPLGLLIVAVLLFLTVSLGLRYSYSV